MFLLVKPARTDTVCNSPSMGFLHVLTRDQLLLLVETLTFGALIFGNNS